MACSAACRAALASGDDSTVAIHWPRAHSRSRVLYMTAGLLLVLVLPCLACLGSPAAGFPCRVIFRGITACSRRRWRGARPPHREQPQDARGPDAGELAQLRALHETVAAQRERQMSELGETSRYEHYLLFVSLLPPPAHRWTSLGADPRRPNDTAVSPRGWSTPRRCPAEAR